TPSAENNLRLTQEFESAVGTAIVETIAASLPQTEQPSADLDPTSTVSIDENQQSLQPTSTRVEQPTQTKTTILPTETAIPTPCYRAELVEETVPDWSKFSPGKWFAKTWIIKNTGVCEWTEDFRWVLVEGEDFSGVTDVPLNKNVLPGEDLRVLLELKAPLIAGTYQGTYQIFTEEGASVTPLGFWVLIVVE
ncbi:MAG: hypothetical protein GWO30_00765, partial [Gammaproteobacteria bacterium]|nr:hypothetical protein [Gammaproteobacteria bacterium]NIV92171.1 hypothetical protein [candidate division KSB1 bacterium]NIY19020.1 hypothetical protein [Gammaproteobacteria bacterium]